MVKINYMSTLFIGIDVSSKSNVVCAMDFDENRYISSSFKNRLLGNLLFHRVVLMLKGVITCKSSNI